MSSLFSCRMSNEILNNVQGCRDIVLKMTSTILHFVRFISVLNHSDGKISSGCLQFSFTTNELKKTPLNSLCLHNLPGVDKCFRFFFFSSVFILILNSLIKLTFTIIQNFRFDIEHLTMPLFRRQDNEVPIEDIRNLSNSLYTKAMQKWDNKEVYIVNPLREYTNCHCKQNVD